MLDLVSVLAESCCNVCGSLKSEKVDGRVSEDSEIVSSCAVADTAVVFAKGGVADPMKTILDVPVLSPPGEKLTRIGTTARDAGDGVLRLDSFFAVAQGASRESANLSHAGPIEMLG